MVKLPDPVSIKSTEIILGQMKNSICYIYLANGYRDNGFFCKIPYKEKILSVLITSNHLLDKEYILQTKEINISFNNLETKINLMNKIIYTSKEYDITIIEVNNLDEIYNIRYLELDNVFDENLKKKIFRFSVYYPHYSHRSRNIYVSYGIAEYLKEEEDKRFRIFIETEHSSSSPIINLENNKVVGIMMGRSLICNFRIGNFLKYPIIELNQNINLIKEFKDYKKKDFEKLEFISRGGYGDIYSAYSIKDKKNLC